MFSRLFFFFLCYLIKQICNSSLSNAINIFIGIITSLHCEGLSTTCLPVSKHSTMVSFHYLTNQSWYAKTLIYIVLIIILPKYLIKWVNFASIETTSYSHLLLVILVWNLNLVFTIHLYFTYLMSLLFFIRKKRTNSNSYFNFAAIIIFWLNFRWA